MLIDTHCHLDAPEFDTDRETVMTRAHQAGVGVIVIPAVEVANFQAVQTLAHRLPRGAYALGIHPMYVPQAADADLEVLEHWLARCCDDPRLVAVGEIGLDFFIPALCEPVMQARQQWFYEAQLDLALKYGLPVLLHVRRSQDQLLRALRRRRRVGGIAHAFNGSFQQAQQFIDQGFALGMGGAMTFSRALQIRRLATQLSLDALVLETDAPDIAPAWLGQPGGLAARNEPAEVAGIANTLAQLRQLPLGQVIEQTAQTACRVLPRLGGLLAQGV